MKLFRLLKTLNFSKFWKLIKLCFPNLLFLWPTYNATKDCMSISEHYFQKKHYQNGKANAFRHSLWNVLIAKRCCKVSANLQKVLQWTKNITDWHEEAFFSHELPMKMDYHNNRVGRKLLAIQKDNTEHHFIKQLLELTNEAVKIDEATPLTELENQLVYISDDD